MSTASTLSPHLATDFDIEEGETGLFYTIYTATFAIGGPILGFIASYGVKKINIFCFGVTLYPVALTLIGPS
jgi:MFS family permease